MATTKITVTLADDQLQEIRSLVAAGQAANISAFVKHAVGVALSDAAGWKDMLDIALQQTGGPLTDEERKLGRRNSGTASARSKRQRQGRLSGVTLDAGGLIAFEENDRRVLALLVRPESVGCPLRFPPPRWRR